MRGKYGTTRSGRPIDYALLDKLVEEAEKGYDVDEILERGKDCGAGGSGPASVVPAQLDPELRDALTERAERDHEPASAVIRQALRSYLAAD